MPDFLTVRVEGKDFLLTAGRGYGINKLTASFANAILRFNPASTEVEVQKIEKANVHSLEQVVVPVGPLEGRGILKSPPDTEKFPR